MNPMHESFWNIGDVRDLVHLFMIIPLSVFVYGLYRHFRLWNLGKRRGNLPNNLKRGNYFWANVFGHQRILQDRYAGFMHVFIFVGFILLFLGTLVIFFEDTVLRVFFGTKILQGRFYEIYELVLDLAGVFLLVGVLMALVRRYFLKPPHLAVKREDGFVFLIFLLIIVSGFMLEGLRLSLPPHQISFWSPVGSLFAGLFQFSFSEAFRSFFHKVLWWFHLGVSFLFIALIPFTKLLHLLTAPLHIFFHPFESPGRMTAIDLSAETVGVNRMKDFSWDTLLSFDACTDCGRCRAVCPSYLSGGPLDPRQIILNLQLWMRKQERHHFKRTSPAEWVGSCVSQNEIWACTTCFACIKECPVLIAPMHRLIDFRHHLVLTDTTIPPEIERVYRNLEWIGDPFGMGKLNRDELSKSPLIQQNATGDPNPFLFWVGCQGYFHERNRKTIEAVFRLFKRLNIPYRILGREEPCCGDLARRTGNEYLFRTLAEKNIQILHKGGFTKIVTACPHCFHVLKNEYPELGGKFQVFHYFELIKDYLPKNPPISESLLFGKVTFQDPCYLSRYNGLVSEARALLQSVPGIQIEEMPRNRAHSFCCGGGGGGVLLGGQTNKKVNEVRLKEALATNVDHLVTACPYCLIMFEEGVKNLSTGESSLKVVDTAEVLAGAFEC